ncbi:hypothetical protein J3R30DRAFT_3232751, partial [Lentinula aciculospora]
GSDVQGTALKLSIGHGIVLYYCRRCVRVFRELKAQYVGFPNEQDLQYSIAWIEEKTGFKKRIGSGDGFLV